MKFPKFNVMTKYHFPILKGSIQVRLTHLSSQLASYSLEDKVPDDVKESFKFEFKNLHFQYTEFPPLFRWFLIYFLWPLLHWDLLNFWVHLSQIKAFSSATLFSFSLFPVSLLLMGIPELSLNVLQLSGPCWSTLIGISILLKIFFCSEHMCTIWDCTLYIAHFTAHQLLLALLRSADLKLVCKYRRQQKTLLQSNLFKYIWVYVN